MPKTLVVTFSLGYINIARFYNISGLSSSLFWFFFIMENLPSCRHLSEEHAKCSSGTWEHYKVKQIVSCFLLSGCCDGKLVSWDLLNRLNFFPANYFLKKYRLFHMWAFLTIIQTSIIQTPVWMHEIEQVSPNPCPKGQMWPTISLCCGPLAHSTKFNGSSCYEG